MPDLASVIENISDGETRELDADRTWNLGSDAETDASGWTIEGNGTRVNVSGQPNITLTGENFTFGGFWWDITGCRHVGIRTGPDSGGWTLQRLGWPGIDCDDDLVTLRLGLGDARDGEMTQCYLGGGHQGTALLNSNRRHDGHLTVHNCWVEHYPSGGLKTVDAGEGGPSCFQGTTTIDSTYFAACGDVHVRLGTGAGDSLVYNSSFYINDWIDQKRGVHAYYGDVEVRDCSFRGPSDNAVVARTGTSETCAASSPAINGTEYGVSDPPIPQGCPSSAQEAAAGETGESREPSGLDIINLGDEGLSNGDYIDPYLDEYFQNGNEVRIPPGTYEYDGSGLSGTYSDAWIVGSSQGVVFNRPSTSYRVRPSIRASSGEVRIENITISGRKGELQTRWRCDPQGGDIRLINVNWPDGTVSPSDSQCVYSEGSSGTLYMINCYCGPHGNSIAYMTYSNAGLVMDGCTLMNSNGAVRPSPRGATIRNCQFFGDGLVPQFSQDGGSAEGAWNRMIKNEHSCTMTIENCHFYQTDDCSSPGPFIDDQEGINGSISDTYIHNATGTNPVRGAGGLSASNVHVSGQNTSIPWPDSGNQMPDTEKTVWEPITSGTQPSDGVDDSIEYENRISIFGDGDSAEYAFTVTDDLQQISTTYATIDDEDRVIGLDAEGNVHGGADAFEFNGGITDFAITSGSVDSVEINGSEVDHTQLGYDHHIRIYGDGDQSEYSFEVSGDVEAITSGFAAINPGEDEVVGSIVQGSVVGGADAYMYDGEIELFDIDDAYSHVEIDGVEVDTDQLGSDDPHGPPDIDPGDDEDQNITSGQLLGRIDIATPDGWFETGVYDHDDEEVDEPLEVCTANGWGVIPTVPPEDDGSVVEVYTDNGWIGLRGLLYTVIDDFEAGQIDRRWIRNQWNNPIVREASSTLGGDYVARLASDTSSIICSAPDFRNGLRYYPKSGDRWSIYYRWVDQNPDAPAVHAEHRFGCQNWPYNSGFVQRQVVPGYEARLHFALGEFQLRKLDADQNVLKSTTVPFNFERNQDYRLEIDWHPDQTGHIIARLYYVTEWNTQGEELATVSIEDTEYDRGAITIEGSNDTEVSGIFLEEGTGISRQDHTADRPVNVVPSETVDVDLVVQGPDSGDASYIIQLNGNPGLDGEEIADGVWRVFGTLSAGESETYSYTAEYPPQYGIVGASLEDGISLCAVED